jgi:hypothetical protein
VRASDIIVRQESKHSDSDYNEVDQYEKTKRRCGLNLPKVGALQWVVYETTSPWARILTGQAGQGDQTGAAGASGSDPASDYAGNPVDASAGGPSKPEG